MAENHNIEKAVKFLVQDNFEVEDGLERIVWLPHGAGDKIRLIKVNRNGIPTGKIEAFYFAPFAEVPFETYLAEVTPKEWQHILRGKIPLPEGWSLEGSIEFLKNRRSRTEGILSTVHKNLSCSLIVTSFSFS